MVYSVRDEAEGGDVDTVTPGTRSRIMSSIRSKHTKPEGAMASALRRARATGWRRHRKVAGVEVDFAWPEARVGIQVAGCFWHACPVHYRMPKTNRAFWRAKIQGNRRRDDLQARWLRTCGWLVMVFFECSVMGRGKADMIAHIVRRSVLPPRRDHLGDAAR